MDISHVDYCNAISLYRGLPGHLSMSGGVEALIREYGQDVGEQLAKEIDAIFSYVDSIGNTLDWNAYSLLSAAQMVEREVHKLYPRLSENALHLVGNFFAYGWK